jgi:uncharacterized protein (TIGR03083 family)
MPQPVLSFDEHLAAIRREADLMVAAVSVADLDTMVPTCPEWTVRELTQHLGRMHIWAAEHVEQARSTPLSAEQEQAAWGQMPADDDLVSWYRSTAARLVTTLEQAPSDLVAWTFLKDAPAPRAFWARRQAHELSIHRADAQGAVGAVDAVPADFATDGIEELVFGFFPRRSSRLRSDTPVTLSIQTDDRLWLVHIGPEPITTELSDAPGDCTVRGSASDVYQALWNRRSLHDLRVGGDPAVLDVWTRNARVSWS